ncbi:MAG TPA: 50S ribosomal protein L11 methyltransferase, partial [Rhizomicrobium sp.]|nr:50S ribosomal protein L11 methyltransferase [Rhizomicrobium sp.]
FRDVLDLGSGTGLLAIGAARLWKNPVLASDIDPVAVEVIEENARSNGVGPLVRAVVADGLIHPVLAAGAPYDLIMANILAGPLTRLAPQIVNALKPRGVLVLSGLLHNQEAMVRSFYHRLRFLDRRREGPWSALVLEKPGR